MWEKKPNCNTYIHRYIFMSNCSIRLEGNQSTSSSRMIAAVKTYHNTSKSVNCLLLESVSGLIYLYQFKQLKNNHQNMGQKSLWFWIFTHPNSKSRGVLASIILAFSHIKHIIITSSFKKNSKYTLTVVIGNLNRFDFRWIHTLNL